MTYLLIKKTHFGKMFSDTFSVVEQSKDINEIKKKRDAHEILKKKDESFNIVMFEDDTSINIEESHHQINLPFPEIQ